VPDKNRQDAWARNFSKFRLLGIRTSIAGTIAGVANGGDTSNITEEEKKSLTHVIAILDDVLDRYESSSLALGFKKVGKGVGKRRGVRLSGWRP
jgi:hypothetical protein